MLHGPEKAGPTPILLGLVGRGKCFVPVSLVAASPALDALVREPFADHLRQPADLLQLQLAPWPDSGIVLCRGGPEERLAQIRFHIVAA